MKLLVVNLLKFHSMKKCYSAVRILAAVFFAAASSGLFAIHAQELDSIVSMKDTTLPKDAHVSKKEEANRNVMLNAESNAGPRFIQIGIPTGSNVDVPTILENDLPVVYYFFPPQPQYLLAGRLWLIEYWRAQDFGSGDYHRQGRLRCQFLYT